MAIAIDPGSPGPEILAALFGIGTGLTLDEFALWLELRDVYWEKEGRKSIDAVIAAAIVAGFGVFGFGIWLDLVEEVETGVRALVGAFGAVALIVAAINAAKEKFWLAIAGLLMAPAGAIGAIRLARPTSLWARAYGEEKRRRARKRFGTPGGGQPPAGDRVGSRQQRSR